MTITELHLDIKEDNSKAISHLQSACSLSIQTLKRAADQGSVWLERDNYVRRLRRLKTDLRAGDALHLYYSETIFNQHPQTATLIDDCHDYSIWFKPAGMYSQGSKWGDHCTITRFAEKSLARNCFLVHRLDRATSGLMLLAHGKKVAAKLAKAFENREVKKTYRAMIKGQLQLDEELTIDSPIEGKEAVTYIACLKTTETFSLVNVTIKTGRKHQIRKHLAHINHPVIGDRLYGDGDTSMDLQLAAYQLGFECPTTGDKKNYLLEPDLLPGHSL